MSQSVYTCIEQLDLAAHQLSKRDPLYARFALMLIDNSVELIIYGVCLQELSFDAAMAKTFGSYHVSSRFTSDKLRDYAKSQRFDKKLKFCKTIKKITSDQFDAINICHKYRNELYHAGLMYNDIIWDIVWFYYDIAIVLLETTADRFWSSAFNITPAVEKHAGKDGKKVVYDIGVIEIANSLRQLKPSNDRNLSFAFSESSVERVNETTEQLEFLVSNSPTDPKKLTEDEIVQELQFYDYMCKDSSVKEVLRKAANEAQNLAEYNAIVKSVREKWESTYTYNPLPKFREQAKKIRKKVKTLMR
ncbi:MAG: hypothetical protein ACXWTN_04290 [Methylosarcina sp.]